MYGDKEPSQPASKAGKTRKSRRSTKYGYLGWSAGTDGMKLRQVFIVHHKDVHREEGSFECKFHRNSDDLAKNIGVDLKGGGEVQLIPIQLPISASVDATIAGGVHRERARRNECIVVEVRSVYVCRLKTTNLPLCDREIKTEDLGAGYFSSGQFIKGYRLTVEGQLESESIDALAKVQGKVQLGAYFAKLGPLLKGSLGGETTRNRGNVRISIAGIGGTVPPVHQLDSGAFSTENFEKEISRLLDALQDSLLTQGGEFEPIPGAITTYPVNTVLQSKYNSQLLLKNEFSEKLLERAINLTDDEKEEFRRQLVKMEEEIKANLKSKDLENPSLQVENQEKLLRIGATFSKMLQLFYHTHPVLDGNFCEVKAKKEDRWVCLAPDADFVSLDYVEHSEETFRVIQKPAQNGFILQLRNGGCVSMSEQQQFLEFGMADERAAVFNLRRSRDNYFLLCIKSSSADRLCVVAVICP